MNLSDFRIKFLLILNFIWNKNIGFIVSNIFDVFFAMQNTQNTRKIKNSILVSFK